MTGARFPPAFADEERRGCLTLAYDSKTSLRCLHSIPTDPWLIQIVKPVVPNQHGRCAGEDFAEDDVVVSIGQIIRPQHIMALASLGILEIQVFRTVSVAILSTGEEVVPHYAATQDHLVRDANGPFLETALGALERVYDFGGASVTTVTCSWKS